MVSPLAGPAEKSEMWAVPHPFSMRIRSSPPPAPASCSYVPKFFFGEPVQGPAAAQSPVLQKRAQGRIQNAVRGTRILLLAFGPADRSWVVNGLTGRAANPGLVETQREPVT